MKMVNTLKRLISIFAMVASSFPALSYSATQSSYPTKGTPVAGDKALITDSADGNKTKQATVGSLPISTATQNALDGKETKAVIQATAPADTTVDWYDTDQESGVLVLKRHNGTTWVRASSHGVQYASNCAGITAGMCVDTDDGKLYYHNNTSVVEVGTGAGSGISHAPADGNYYASKDNAWASLSGVFASPLGSDDNYVTDAEKIKLGNLSGTNTGDQDLSGYSLTSSVLTKTNTTAFSPTGDYHPATKKYVDDAVTAGGGYTDEQAQDAVGGMFSGNTETGIAVTYNDTTGKVDFVVATQFNGTQSTSGNSATATKLQNARTIGGVSFDGSANISLPGVNAAGNQNTTGNAATATSLATNPTDCTAGLYANAISADGNLTCGQVAYSQVSGTPTITDDQTASEVTVTPWSSYTGTNVQALMQEVDTALRAAIGAAALPSWMPSVGPTNGRQILQATGGCSLSAYDNQADCQTNGGTWTTPTYQHTSIISGLINDTGTADDDLWSAAKIAGDLAGKQASLGFTPENTANKGAANGYAGLGSDGKVPSSQLPQFTGTDDQTASEVPITTWGSYTGTNVQALMQEVDTALRALIGSAAPESGEYRIIISPDIGAFVTSSHLWGQTWTVKAGQNGTLSSVKFYTKSTITANVTCRAATSNGQINMESSYAVGTGSLTGVPGEFTVSFSSGPTLTEGGVYAVACHHDGSGDAEIKMYTGGSGSTGPYTGGGKYLTTASDWDLTGHADPADDYYFVFRVTN